MAHFIVRWGFKDISAKAMVTTPQDRTETARALVESFGGKLHDYYFTFGDYDGIEICEFPDNVSAAAFSMAAASTGGYCPCRKPCPLANEVESDDAAVR